MNGRWFIACLIIAGLGMYFVGPTPVLQAVISIPVVFLFIAGLIAPIAVRASRHENYSAEKTAYQDARNLFSAGFGALVGSVIGLFWLIPLLPYWR